jgi:small-conductance mechanosensitive channel
MAFGVATWGQSSQTPATSQDQQAPKSATSLSISGLNQQDIVQFLDDSVRWHQQLALGRHLATEPSELLYANNSQPTADEIVRLSFEFARAGAQLLGKNAKVTAAVAGSGDARYQNLAQMAAKLDGDSARTKVELDSLRQKLAAAGPAEKQTIQSSIAETQSELNLLGERRTLVGNMMQFIDQSTESGGLSSQIDALERSVPAAEAGEKPTGVGQNNGTTSVVVAPNPNEAQPTSLWGAIRNVFAQTAKLERLKADERRTDALIDSAKRLQAPLRATFADMAAESDKLMNLPEAQDPTALDQQKAEVDALTSRLQQVGAGLLPLSKELLLLNVYKKNLDSWSSAVTSEYSANLKSVLLRLLVFVAALAIVLAIFEAWRRTIIRYVPDLRRRYQFLLLRRIALWLVLGMLITLALVSEIGSLATFAGLLTAGVAVALQNVILAVLGYFLLIGKFGVQVGDRVQVSGVFGEVVEIGLIRMHVMEFAGPGTETQPTGRVVAFSNAVVFQPNVGLFRQIPGASLVWHEITLTLAADSDYRVVEERIVPAVQTAFRKYEPEFEKMRRRMEMNLSSVAIGSLTPKVHLRLTPAGMEVLVQFPVETGNAQEIDQRVTQELLRAINMEPKLRVVGAEVPTVRVKCEAAKAN